VTDVKLTRKGAIFILTMGSGDQKPAFNTMFMERTHHLLDQVEASDHDAALIITSEHPTVWNMGLDLEWIVKQPTDYYSEFGALMDKFFLRVSLLNIPTIGCLIGHTIGAGLIMASCMDFRFMREDRGWMRFPAVDVKLGFTPTMHRVVEQLPNRRALKDMLLTGRNVGAIEAASMGIIDGALPREGVIERSFEIADLLSKKDRKTYTEIKRGIKATRGLKPSTVID
jgi:enoyl-CoA hydratase/carnithine racemase